MSSLPSKFCFHFLPQSFSQMGYQKTHETFIQCFYFNTSSISFCVCAMFFHVCFKLLCVSIKWVIKTFMKFSQSLNLCMFCFCFQCFVCLKSSWFIRNIDKCCCLMIGCSKIEAFNCLNFEVLNCDVTTKARNR